MSFRFNHSGDSSTPTNYELSNGQSLDLNTGDTLKLTNPDDIADMIPQGHDVLVLTKDGSSYLLKNFLLADNTELELPDGTTINADNFLDHHGDSHDSHAGTELRGISFEPEDATGSVVLQSVTLLSIISALSQNTSAFDEFKLNADGSENPELQNYFKTLTLAALSENQENQNQAQIAELAALEEQNTLFNHGPNDVADDESDTQTHTSNTSNGEPSKSVSIDVTDSIDATNLVDFNRVRFTATVVNSEGEVVESETVVDEETGTVEVVVDIGENDGGNQVEVEIVITDPSTDDKVIDRSEITVVLPDPFNNENVTLSLSGSDVLENEAGYSIGSLAALGSDKDIEGPFTYRILSDQSGLFDIEGDTLKLKDGTAIDFETAPGKYEISIRIENEDGTQIDRTLTLHPADANDAPEMAEVQFDGVEDTSIPFDRETFEQAFSDVDGDDTLESVRIDSLPQNGTLSLDGIALEIGQTISVEAIATISFQPNPDWNGHTDFQWSGFDGTDWSAHSATVSIDTENINDAPVATFSIAAQTANEDAAFSFEIPEALFADIDAGDSLTLSANLPEWLSFDPETGKISGVPSYQNVGEHRIEITATDASGAKSTTSFTLDVENVNDRPTFTQIQDVSISEYNSVNIDAVSAFSDEDASFGDTLSFSATLSDGADLPEWLAIDETSGKITGTPPQGEDTDLDIRVTATDNSGESVSNTFALHVENQNDAPELTSEIADQSIDEDSEFSFNIASNFTDSDLADTLTYSATLPDGSPLPDWLSFDPASGQFSGIPGNDDVGMLTIQVTASDGSKNVNDFFAIMVDNTNDKPTATALVDQTAKEDQSFSLDISDSFTDVDLGDTLTFTATLTNGSELPDWLSFDETTGKFSGVPTNEDVGELSVLVVASDGEANASEIFSIEVENTNDRPVASFIPPQTATEDTQFLFDASSAFSDEDLGDELTYTATLENGDPLPDWVTLNRFTGELSGTPENANVGNLSITLTASDGEASASTSLQISVQNTNDGPIVSTSIASQTDAEDSSFSLNTADNFSDADLGDSLSYSATLENGDPLPSWLTFDSETGSFSGTPDNSDVGNLRISVTATDGSGETASSTFSLEVENTNDAPVVWTNFDDQTTSEDSVFSLDASSHFGDVDFFDTLTFSAALENGEPLPDWLSIDPATGILSGTPTNDDLGQLSITVSASDGQQSTSDTFTLTVENTNDGPTVSSDIADKSILEDDAFVLETIGNFNDVDSGDTLTFSATLEDGSPLPSWLHLDPETGTLSGTPENGDVGNLSITVTATDESGETASSTFGINVANTNDGPVATAISDVAATEDATFTLDVSSSFSDIDASDTLTYSATLEDGSALPDWLSIDPETGTLSGTPENGDVGDLSITVTATDESGSTASSTLGINVANTNDGPVASAISDTNAIEDTAFEYNVASQFSDEDLGDSLVFEATLEDGSPLPSWLSFDEGTGQFSGTPENADVGNISITVTATDGDSIASQSFSISIANTNDGPVATAIDDTSATEDAAFTLDVSSSFSDVDAGDSLTYSATLEDGSDLPDWLSIDPATGTLSGTPDNGDVGDLSITITATDDSGETASSSFGIAVANTNDGPVATAIDDASATEDAAFSIDVSSSFSDVDAGDSLTYSATLEDGSDLPDWLSIDPTTGTLSGTPDNGDVGDLSITVTATDDSGETASSSFGIAVANTNDGPVATAIDDASATEDAAFTLNVSSSFSDVDAGDSLTYSATLEDGSDLPAWLSIDPATGTLSGTPENGDVGNLSITVTATDESGSTASSTFGISVENTNDGPVDTAIDDTTATEDAAFTLDVSSSFSDVDAGDSLTYSATLEDGSDLPAWLSIDPATGQLSGSPENGDVGNLSITVTATDGSGSTASSSFAIAVDNTNDGPVATAISDAAATEDAAFTLDVSSSFSDVDAGDSLSFSATLEDGSDLPDWLSIDPATGTLSGTPENADVGDLSITVTATDESGSTASSTFGINVANTNDGPVATAISDAAATEDAAFTLDVSSSFSDIDVGDTLSYSATLEDGSDLPSWLSIDPATGTLSGTPGNGDVGNLSITVTATDESGSTASSTFGISVENTNDGPVATAIEDAAATEDAAFSLDVSSSFSDIDVGDTLSYSATLEDGSDLPSWLSIDPATGTLSGTPENGDVGNLSITVTATDESGSTASSTFGISVDNTNDGPAASAISDTNAIEDTAFEYNVASQFSDEDLGDSLVFEATLEDGSPLPSWLSFDEGTGQFSGTPENADVGNISITVTATDGESIASQSFSISIANTNDGPVATAIDDTSATEDAAFTLDVSSSFSDIDARDSLTYSATLEDGSDLPDWLSIDPATGTLSGTPENGDVGNLSITVTATDESGSTASSTFGISVDNTNDGPVATAISDAAATEDAAFSLDVSSSFSDVDAGDTLSYSATLEDGSDLPAWLSIDPATGTLSGTTENGDVGDLSITVTATDESGSTVSSTFGISVANTNDGPVATAIEDATATEDAAFTLDVSSSFSDVDAGDSLSFSATLEDGSDLPDWLSIDPETGTLSGIPENGDVGNLSITVTVTDGSGSTASSTFGINVDNTNDGPVATAIDDAAATEDAAFSLDVSSSFSDVDAGDSLTYSATLDNGDPLPSWLSIDPATGTLSGTPENADVGDLSITVTATDGSGSTASSTFGISVDNTNDGPVATAISDAAAPEDAAFTLDVSSSFSDVDAGDTLTFSATLDNGEPLPSWLSIDPATGTLSGTPENADVDDLSITVTATDGSGSTASSTFGISVDNTNDGPVATAISDAAAPEDAAFTLDVSSSFSDVDAGDTLTFSATLDNGEPLPSWLSIDPATGTLSGTPDNGDVGNLSITVTATDGSGATASSTFGISVANTNDGPVATAISDAAATEDATFTLDVSSSFSDIDAGDTLTFSATLEDGSDLPSWLSIDPETGTLSGTPDNGDVGDLSITVTAVDGSGATAASTFGINVANTNDGPVATAIDNTTASEDAAFSLDVSSSFSDVDAGDSLTYSATLEDGSDLPNWLSIDPATGTLSGTPENGDVGDLSITVTATDGSGSTASSTLAIAVDNTNDGPVATAISDAAATEDAAFSLDVSSSFSDVDAGDTLTFSAILEDGSDLPSWLSIDPATGTLSGTPENGDVGNVSITVTATDGSGSTASSTFGIAVANTNDGPVATAISDAAATEDAAFTLDVSSSFSDVDAGDSLTYSATLEDGSDLPAWLSIDPATGTLSGTPENADVGDLSITVTATDGSGSTASSIFAIAVANTNDRPVATAIDDAAATEDAAFSLDVSSSFSDVDAGDSLSFSATLEDGSDLPNWFSIDPATGTLSGTPENGDVGDLSITVTATDESGSTASSTFGINVANTNDGPVATAVSDAAATEDAAFSLDVSSSFSDVDAGDSLTFSATLDNGDPIPSWLSIDPATGTLSGTPDNADVGNHSITVTATDGSGATASSTFSISVDNTNDGPVATAIDDTTATEDATFSIDVSSSFSDVDAGDSLTFSATLDNGEPLPSWLSIDPATGTLSGTPENADVGDLSITVTATDESGSTASSTFGISVANTNDGPVATAISDAATSEDAAFSLDVSSSFSDVDAGDSLSFSATLEDGSDLPSWLSIDPATGTLSGTPENGDVGNLSITVTATDGSGSTASSTFGISVANTNDGPVATAIDDTTATEDAAFTLDVSSSFSDVDAGDSLTYSATLEDGSDLPDWLSIDPATGQLSGTPENGDVGDLSITVTATDESGSTASSTFGISVDNTNDGPVATAISAAAATEDAAFSIDVSSSFSDVDAGDSLTFSATLDNGEPLPSWLSIDPATGTLSGTPDNADVGNLSITVTATDESGSTASSTFGISVDNTNDGPVATAIDDATATEDAAFTLDVSSSFSDVDAGDSLSYSATLEDGSDLPSWLSIDPATGQLSGTPENADVGDLSITVTATDESGSTASSTFGINVANTNDGPVATAISDQEIDRGYTFNLDVSSNFTDIDVGDSLTYSATLTNGDPLPDWLTFDTSTGEFSGTPSSDDAGSLEISVTAIDTSGESATETFNIDVNEIITRTGDGAANTLTGDDYGDNISGGQGSDNIIAGGGNDEIYGDDAPGASTSPSGNYIINGSFEDVVNGTNQSWGISKSNVEGWTDANGTDFEMHVDDWEGMDAPTDGSYFLDMAESPGKMDISQTVQGLQDGATYTLSFDAGDRSGDLSNSMQVYFGGQLIATIDPSSQDTWASYSFDVTGGMGDGSNTLRFVETGGYDNVGISLDNVQLVDTNNDTIDAGAGDDTITAGSGDDIVDGGEGTDTIVLSGNRSEYMITANGDGTYNVEDTVGGRDGTDTVSNIESVQFTDQTVTFAEAINSGPEVTQSIGPQTVNEDATFSINVADYFSDSDGHNLSFVVKQGDNSALPDWLKFDSETGILSGTPDNADVGDLSIKILATDGQAWTTHTFDLAVENTNDGPIQAFQESDGLVSIEAENYHQKTDRGDDTWSDQSNDEFDGVYMASGDTENSWGTSDAPASSELSYVVNFDTPGTYYVWVRANAVSDGGEDYADDSLHIGLDGETITGSGGLTGFGNNGTGWGSLDTNSYNRITLTVTEPGQHTLNIWAREDGVAVDKIVLTTDANYAPSTINNGFGPDESARTGEMVEQTASDADFSYTLESDVFVDVDTGDTLTYSATLDDGSPLPNWLSFDADTMTFSGDPTGQYDQSMTIKVTASDGTASLSDTFTLNVSTGIPQPVGQWKLDETSGTTATDSSGDNDGTYQNGTTLGAEGALETGTSASFDGVDDFVEIAPSSDFQLAQGTFVISFSPDQLSGKQALFSRDSTGYDGGGHITAWVQEDGSIEVRLQSGSQSYTLTSGSGMVTAGENHQMAISFGSEGMQLFLDGDLVNTNDYTGGIEGNNEPITLGANQWKSGDGVADYLEDYFDGHIDNFEIYDSQLSQSNASGLYQNVDATTPLVEDSSAPMPELLGQWKLDESSGSNAEDSVSDNDGTYKNCVSVGQDGILTEGMAAHFDGCNDYVLISPSEDFQVAEGTFAITFNADRISGQQTLFSRDSSGFDNGGHIDAYIESDGTLTIRIQSADTSYYISSSSGAITAGTDHQMAFSFGPDGAKLFLDGQLVGKSGYTGGIENNNQPITLGTSLSSSGDDVATNMHDFFKGTIDNFEIYNGQFNAAHAEDLYTQLSGEVVSETGTADADLIEATTGADSIDGGEGSDTYVLSGNRADYYVTDNGDGTYQIQDSVASRDGTDTLSNIESLQFADQTVDIAEALNEAPILDSAITDVNIDEDAAFSLDVSTNFSDADGHTLTYTATLANGCPLPGWLSIDPETGVLSGTPENDDVGAISVKVTASDFQYSVSDTFSIEVANTNDGPTALEGETSGLRASYFNLDFAPSELGQIDFDVTPDHIETVSNVNFSLGNGAIYEGGPSDNVAIRYDGNIEVDEAGTWNFRVGGDDGFRLFVDGQEVTALDGLHAHASSTGSIELDAGSHSIQLIYFEKGGNSSLKLEWQGPSDGGYSVIGSDHLTTPSIDVSTYEDAPFSLDVSDYFSDVDVGDSLTLSATLDNGDPLPNWLTFDPSTGTFTGAPENEDVGDISVSVTATDTSGATATSTFAISVANTNDGPVATAITDAAADENSAFSLDVSGNFSDVDAGDTLTFSATLENGDPLPDWLSIDPSTGVLSGTPVDGDEGSLSVTVTATDAAGASASDTFSIDVANTNDAPTDLIFTQPSSLENQAADVTYATLSTGSGGGEVSTNIDFSSIEDGSGTIELEFAYVDNSFEVAINGESLTGETIQLQQTDYNSSTEVLLRFQDGGSMSDPWTQSNNSDPRIKMTISENGVEVWGLRTPTSTTYERMELDDGTFSAPNLIDGSNTLTVVNPDGAGGDGLSLSVAATYSQVTTALTTDESGNVTATVAENLAGAQIAVLSSTDPDASDTASYSIESDPSGLFEVVDNTLKLKDGSSLDYETQSTHQVVVKVTDSFGATRSETITVQAADVHEAAAGNSYYGNWETETFTTGSGNDTIYTGGGDDTVNAGDGDNTVIGDYGTESITTGSGDDYIQTNGGSDVVNAGEGNNTVIGSYGDETITTGSGDDYIETNGGDDVVNAGDGNNVVVGTYGNETITTGSGNDTITAGWGTDIIDSGDGNDTIHAASEEVDTIYAGAGDDIINLSSGGVFGEIDAGAGDDVLNLTGSGQWLDFTNISAQNQLTNIERIDIDGAGANNLKLSAADVLDMTDADNCLFVDGGADDTVQIDSSYSNLGTENIEGTDYSHYYDSVSETHLYINNDITDTPLF